MHAVEELISRLVCFGDLAANTCFEPSLDRFWHTAEKVEFLEDRNRIRKGRRVWSRDSGADDIRRIADHIREQQAHNRGGVRKRSQLAALQHRKVFSHGVQLKNRRACSQQMVSGSLFVPESDRFGWGSEQC